MTQKTSYSRCSLFVYLQLEYYFCYTFLLAKLSLYFSALPLCFLIASALFLYARIFAVFLPFLSAFLSVRPLFVRASLVLQLFFLGLKKLCFACSANTRALQVSFGCSFSALLFPAPIPRIPFLSLSTSHSVGRQNPHTSCLLFLPLDTPAELPQNAHRSPPLRLFCLARVFSSSAVLEALSSPLFLFLP
jgi:hypothetical protein